MDKQQASAVCWSTPSEVLDRPLPEATSLADALLRLDDAKRAAPNDWVVSYGSFDMGAALRRLDAMEQVLGQLIPSDEFAHCETFVRTTHAVYDGSLEPEPGDYAFVVPTRTFTQGFRVPDAPRQQRLEYLLAMRSHPGMDYANELAPFLPIVDCLDPVSRHQIYSEIPPMVFERYAEAANGRRGFIVYAPATLDMMYAQPSKREVLNMAKKMVGSAIELSRDRYGIEFAGIAATFPAITRYGQSLTHCGVPLTTGHAGTVNLIGGTVESLRRSVPAVSDVERVAIVGAGSIGKAAAEYLLRHTDLSVDLFDIVPGTSKAAVADLRGLEGMTDRVKAVASLSAAAARTRLFVSATTTPVAFESFDNSTDLQDLYVIDDSEPGSFNDPRFRSSGIRVVGVVGTLPSTLGARHCGYNNYGNEVARPDEGYGCEAELKVLDYLGRSSDGIMRAVTSADVEMVRSAFEEVGVSPAPLQYRGQYLGDELVDLGTESEAVTNRA